MEKTYLINILFLREEIVVMQISNSITQNRVFSGTCKIAGIHLPNFSDAFVYTRQKSGISDSEYKKAIIEQAKKDQAEGKFQTDSNGFNQLAKKYVQEVSPDRKKIITEGLQKIHKNDAVIKKRLDVLALLFEGKVKFKKDSDEVTYAEFYDSNGEMVATYSNGGWTMLHTNAETARQIQMCSIYNEAWREANNAELGSTNVPISCVDDAEVSENPFNMLA